MRPLMWMQIQSPSGRAVFRFEPGAASTAAVLDVVTCFVPQSFVSTVQTGSGATTAYRNGTFTWTLTPYNDPFGFK